MTEEEKKHEVPVFLDHASQQGGLEKPPEGLAAERCPQCGSETQMGFGMMGGGMGTYVMCTGDNCDWFYKEQSKE